MNAGNRPASLRHLDHNCSENGNLAVLMPSPGGALCAANQNFNDCRRQSYHSVGAPPLQALRPKQYLPVRNRALVSDGQFFLFRQGNTAQWILQKLCLAFLSIHSSSPPKKQLGQAFKTLARLPRQEYLPLGYAIFIAVNAQASSADSTDARPYSVPPYDDIVILSGSAFRSHWTAVSAKARTTGSASP